jgi:predicted nucleic acid-binding protein
MRSIYVDTGAFIALIWQRDRDHDRVVAAFRRLRSDGGVLITSEAVVSETATRLRYDAGLAAVAAYRSVLDRSEAQRTLRIRPTDAVLRGAAFDLMGRYSDLRLSFADAVGAAVARDERADAVLALDDDFRALGFTVEP